MEKRKAHELRIGIWWSAAVAVFIALIAGYGALTKGAIVGLCACLAGALSFAAFEHGWFHAPRPVGTIPRTILLILMFCGLSALLGYGNWPRTGRESEVRQAPESAEAKSSVPAPQSSPTVPSEVPNISNADIKRIAQEVAKEVPTKTIHDREKNLQEQVHISDTVTREVKHAPTIAFTYEADAIRVSNVSDEEIALTDFSFGQPIQENAEPRLIAPGFYYFLRLDKQVQQQLSNAAQTNGGTALLPCWAFISVQRADTTIKYTAKCLMHIVATEEKFNIDMQNLGLENGWITLQSPH